MKYLCLLILLLVTAGHAQESDLSARIETYLSPLLTGGNYSGTILIEQRGKVLVNKGQGLADILLARKNTPQTRFQIASLSKSFTAAAILLLIEDGKLKFDDPVGQHLPELSHFEGVTIHHLLSHHSGIPDINRQPDYRELLQNHHTPASLVSVISKYKLSATPGENYVYSNSNYNILARVIEVVSGSDFGAFLQQRLFDPLDLENTGHRGKMSPMVDRLATGYVPSGGIATIKQAPNIDWSVKTGNGSLYSTTGDLLKWSRGLLGGKLLRPSSLSRMLAQKYGWFVREKLGEDAIYYNGSSPGFSAYLGHFPERELNIIVLGNNDIALASTIGEALAAMVLGKEVPALPDLSPMEVDEDFLASVAGKYKFPYYTFEILTQGGQLVYRGGYPYYDVAMISLAQDKIFNRFFWSNLIVEQDETGAATHVYWEGNSRMKGERVED